MRSVLECTCDSGCAVISLLEIKLKLLYKHQHKMRITSKVNLCAHLIYVN